jgi:hypothetical protein
MTTAYTPNTEVSYSFGGATYDIDFNSIQEGKSLTQPTYAAVTARSYHAGNVVNVTMLDGATRTMSAAIDLSTWRALGTISGAEVVGGAAIQ